MATSAAPPASQGRASGRRRGRAPPGPEAERLRGFQRARAVRQEGAARHQVDIRIDRERQHRDHAAGRTDRRHDRPAPKQRAQRRSARPRVIERRDRDEGEHVGRHRHRQQQRPGEERRGRGTRRPRSARRARCRAPRRSRPRRSPATTVFAVTRASTYSVRCAQSAGSAPVAPCTTAASTATIGSATRTAATPGRRASAAASTALPWQAQR